MFASSSLAVFVFAACVTRGFFYYFTNVDPLFKRLEPPVVLVGRVVSGFGRGSKELGIPTANLDPEALGSALDGVTPGVYCGWAAVDGSVPYKTVMSIGFNPFYQGTKMTVEPHIVHTFEEPFYGKELRLLVTAFMRPELNFTSLADLIDAIKYDIEYGCAKLEEPGSGLHALQEHDIFKTPVLK